MRDALVEDVRDAVRDDARFAASCSGDDQNRSVDCHDGSQLFGVEFRFQCMYVEFGHGAQCSTRNAFCASARGGENEKYTIYLHFPDNVNVYHLFFRK